MTRPVYRVNYEIAYCAWMLIAPAWVAKYPQPELSPWTALLVDVVRSGVAPKPDDVTPGQYLRRAIIARTAEDMPLSGEIRMKAIVLEGLARQLTAERLAEIGTPAVVCRALAPAVQLAPVSRSA